MQNSSPLVERKQMNYPSSSPGLSFRHGEEREGEEREGKKRHPELVKRPGKL